jgi:hypothetical protein
MLINFFSRNILTPARYSNLGSLNSMRRSISLSLPGVPKAYEPNKPILITPYF